MNQITIKDIAQNLGISTSTVSRALNDHPDIRVETKKQVNKLATKMGYEPNFVARSLKSKNSSQLGIIVPEIKHDFFSKIISGTEEVAYKNGFTVIVSQSNEEKEREKLNANSLYLNRIAGMMISLSQTTESIEHLKVLLKKGVNIVQFDRVSNELDTYKVVIDDFQASYDAVNYLIKKGYKNIFHLAGPKILLNCQDRLRGFEAALKDSGMTCCKENIITGGMHEQDGQEAIKKVLSGKNKCDALFCVNDPVAIGAAVELKNNGLRIPDDIAIVGFSNNPITEFFTPSITTVEQPAYEMGKLTASILISMIKGEKTPGDKKIHKLKSKLIVREST